MMNLSEMIAYWEKQIPLTEAAVAAAQKSGDHEEALTLHTLVMQQRAVQGDLEALRIFWLGIAAKRPEAAGIIREFCNGESPLATITKN